MPEAVAQAPSEAAFIARALRLKKGQRVLDLCCGTGRHSFELARRGALVTGLDATQEYLAQARRAAHKTVNPVFVRGDMRRLAFNGEFDAVVNLWTSFGYFEDPSDDLRSLRGAARALKPGGLFLIDVVNGDWNRRHAVPRNWSRRSDGTLVLEETELRAGRDPALLNAWTVIRPGKRPIKASFFVRSYDAARLDALLRRAGLIPTRRWGGLDGSPFMGNSKRLVVLASRN